MCARLAWPDEPCTPGACRWATAADQIRPGSRAVPGNASSFPADSIVSRGRGRARTLLRPTRPAARSELVRAVSRRQQHLPSAGLATTALAGAARWDRLADGDLHSSAVGPLDPDDRVRAGWHGGTRHNPRAGSCSQLQLAAVAGRYLCLDRHYHRGSCPGRRGIGSSDRVTVHRRVVEQWKRVRCGGIFGHGRAIRILHSEPTRHEVPDGLRASALDRRRQNPGLPGSPRAGAR